jgi:hypothetical protein
VLPDTLGLKDVPGSLCVFHYILFEYQRVFVLFLFQGALFFFLLLANGTRSQDLGNRYALGCWVVTASHPLS